MKRLLLSSILLCIVFGIYAQTTVETALPFEEGTVSFTFESSTGQNTVYYVYTAPAEQGKLLTVQTANGSATITLSEDGTYSTMISGINSGNVRIFPIKKGQKVYLAAGVYNESTVNFTAVLKDADVEGGATCGDAISATESDFFVPSYYDSKTYQTKPTFLSYACIDSGLLEMTFGSYPASLVVHEGCEGASESLAITNIGSKYVAKYAVETGKNYIVEVSLYSTPAMASFKLTHPTEGTSCDMPFIGKENNNVLPKATGKYWYQYTVGKNGFMLLASDNGLPGGNISIYKTCSDYSPYASIDGYFAIRCKVDAGATYLICIERADETGSDEMFDITVEDPKMGDSTESPIIIEAGSYTVPQYDGTYYYKVNVPEGDSRFLIVDAKAANLQNSNTSVKLYTLDNLYTPIAQGKDFIKNEVAGNTSYMIVWSCSEGLNSYSFTISYESIVQGDICSNPLPAKTGQNDLSVGAVKYFQYKTTKDGWLLIDTDITVGVSFPKSCQGYGDYDAVKVGTITKMEVTTGVDYLIKFDNIEEATHFTLSEEVYKEGESCSMAIPVEAGDTPLPENVLNHWYKYTATQDGKVTVTADILYEQSADSRKSSSVFVKSGDCSAYPVNITQTNSDGTWFEGQFVVEKDDVLLINIVTCSVQADKKLTLAIRDLPPGEACSLPIALTPGEVTFQEATRSNPVWYAISLQPGDLKVASANAFTLSLFKECNETTPLAQSNYYYDSTGESNSEYRLEYEVTVAGTYVLKLEMSYANTIVNVSGSAIVTGLDPISESKYSVRVENNAIIVNPGDQSVNIDIYDFSGKKIQSRCISSYTSFIVPEGFYIIKIGNYIRKVIVRN